MSSLEACRDPSSPPQVGPKLRISLLPSEPGVRGEFLENEAVKLMDETGLEFARGVVNYNSEQATKLIGCKSDQMADILGYNGPEELVSRQNLALLSPA